MTGADYIVEYLIQKGICDVFGYPGGMVTHLMDSLERHKDQITAHVNYHEQACAMAACGWAEITGLPGVAYATSGPGATNLLTGIACAYFESLPCIFITGQVNTYEQKGTLSVRQRGFQETDIVSMARPITKAAFALKDAAQLPDVLECAYGIAMERRRGPVLLDIPMDVFRGEAGARRPIKETGNWSRMMDAAPLAEEIIKELKKAKRPLILAGHGISLTGMREQFRAFVELTRIPVVTSMIAIDVLPSACAMNYGMIGTYGGRTANHIVDHCDCLLTLGSRLDCRQTGVKKELFAPEAVILRVDIDPGELENKTGERERHYEAPLERLLPELLSKAKKAVWDTVSWRTRCDAARERLAPYEQTELGNRFMREIGELLPDNITVTADVGQNQVWVAQSLPVKEDQRVLFSGGHGAMGYSLPAAIGAAIATKHPVVCFAGDGGLQMNIQEMEFLVREKLPVKIILINNCALGMIHHFQDMYFAGRHAQTDGAHGYHVPSFTDIARAYGICSVEKGTPESLTKMLKEDGPALLEIRLPEDTYVFPKLGMNRPIHQQEPELPFEVSSWVERMLLDRQQHQA